MKKLFALLLAVVMSFTLLTACGNPVYDDFENYLNVETAEINANYEKITAEAATWAEIEDDAALVASLKDTLLPLVEDSLTKLADVNPKTEEVKAVKNKYVAVMEAYKEGFSDILAGFEAEDADQINAGNDKINSALTLLDEYNGALEALASELGAEIEY